MDLSTPAATPQPAACLHLVQPPRFTSPHQKPSCQGNLSLFLSSLSSYPIQLTFRGKGPIKSKSTTLGRKGQFYRPLLSTPRGEGHQDVVSQQEAVTFRFDVSCEGWRESLPAAEVCLQRCSVSIYQLPPRPQACRGWGKVVRRAPTLKFRLTGQVA